MLLARLPADRCQAHPVGARPLRGLQVSAGWFSRPAAATPKPASQLEKGKRIDLLGVFEEAVGSSTAAPAEPTAAAAQAVSAAPSVAEKSSEDESLPRMGALTRLQDRLLNNAASLRMVRSQTTCRRCHGEGRMPCPSCQGAGVKAGGRAGVRMNMVKHAAGKMKAMVGLQGPLTSDDDWMMTNRCRRCHGSGACACPVCQGQGKLGP